MIPEVSFLQKSRISGGNHIITFMKFPKCRNENPGKRDEKYTKNHYNSQ